MEKIDFFSNMKEVLSENALNTVMDYCMTFGKNIIAAITTTHTIIMMYDADPLSTAADNKMLFIIYLLSQIE